MAVLDEQGVLKVWAKVKENFGHSLSEWEVGGTSADVGVTHTILSLKNAKGELLSSTNIRAGANIGLAVNAAGELILSAKNTTYEAVQEDTDGLVPCPGETIGTIFMYGDNTTSPLWGSVNGGEGIIIDFTSTDITIKGQAATTSTIGMMSAEDKSKLDSIDEGATKYELPQATASILGGVKIGTGISVLDGVISNAGVRSVGTGSTNGTISVNVGGATSNVSVKGLGSAAYTDSDNYATASHTHSYAGSSTAGGAATSANKLNTNAGDTSTPVYFSNGIPVKCGEVASKSYVDSAITGSSTFKGIITSDTIKSLTNYKAGWYWIVGATGTYVGQNCEIGDTIFCQKNYSSSYKDSDFNVLQVNWETITTDWIDSNLTL